MTGRFAVIAARAASWDPRWPEPDAGPEILRERWISALGRTVECALAAVDEAGLPDPEGVAVALGSLCGTLVQTEYMVDVLSGDGRRFLDPTSFLHNNASSVAATIATGLGTRSWTSTSLGEHAGVDALRVGFRSSGPVVVGAFDWPTPFLRWWLAASGHEVSADRAAAAFLVLEPLERCRDRGATPLRELASPADVPPIAGTPTSAVAPLFRLCSDIGSAE